MLHAAPATTSLQQLAPQELWNFYVRYIGAGCVAVGGVLALVRILPLLLRTARSAWQIARAPHPAQPVTRTERDLSPLWIATGIGLICVALLWLSMGPVPLLLLISASLLFVAVTCITTGLLGSSSNPVSSMTITTLLAVCGIFLALGWTERVYLLSALTLSTVLTCSLAMAGDTAQDLKTGYLVGATPAKQQLSLLLGVILPALSMGFVLQLLHTTYGLGSEALPAPQATLMALIAQGVLEQTLPLGLVAIGVSIGIVFALLRVNVLAGALGLYLPIQLTSAVMLGACIRWLSGTAAKTEDRPGVLLASGLVAGDSLMGTLIALLAAAGLASDSASSSALLGLMALAALCLLMLGWVRKAHHESPRS